MRVLILIAACMSVSFGQLIYTDDFYSLQLRAPKLTQTQLKSLVANLNKETLAKQKTRINNFITNNVPKSDQKDEKTAAIALLETVDMMKKYMTALWKQIKSSKSLGDAKIKELDALFNDADRDSMHLMSMAYSMFEANISTVVPADKREKVKAAISKAKTTFEKNNKAIYAKLFPPPTHGGLGK